MPDSPQTNGTDDWLEQEIACMHCGSTDTEMLSLFGPFHLASQYYCRACGNPFGRMRWDADDTDSGE